MVEPQELNINTPLSSIKEAIIAYGIDQGFHTRETATMLVD